jgi:AcrR family transcriptional regulator
MPPERRRLRRPDEVRSLLVEGARKVFGSKGFEAATTLDIARTAGVAHGLLFRHFGTKAELFERAVFEPFEAGIGRVLARWQTYGHTAHSPAVSSTDFVDLAWQFMQDNAEVITALACSPDYAARVHGEGGDSSLSQLIDTLAEALETEVKVHGWGGIDVPIAMRVAFCAVLGMTVFDRWVFPSGSRHPSDERVKTELAAFLAAGLGGRPALSGH